MKIAFAGDMCFNYFDKNNIFFGKESIKTAMSEAADLFSNADFSMVNLENIFGVREDKVPIVKTGPNLISNEKYIEYITTDSREVKAGDKLTFGAISPKELLVVTDPITVQQYILSETQKVYSSQGVDISDKHIEVIAKRMISKIKIINSGDSYFLPGTMVNINKFTDINKQLIIDGKRPATGRPVLLGITKASLETDSFLSAASFQETTRILTDAAIHGKVDHLNGIKENVIIGKLIPAGTGAKKYRKTDYELKVDMLKDEPLEALEQELMD